MPKSVSGRSAIVFRATVTPRDVAIKCFTNAAPDRRARYQALGHRLAGSWPDYLVDFVYRDDEILVNGNRYPVVEMSWTHGIPLDVWIGRHISRPADLAAMAAKWLAIASDLERRGLAHGDLSAENCLVSGSDLKLIDYDGCYVPVPGLSHRCEYGNPDFQHPRGAGYCAANADAFPALVIYLSLLALASDPALWHFHAEGRLLFSASDYLSPGTAPIWRELANSSNPLVVRLAADLATMGGLPTAAELPPLSHISSGSVSNGGQPEPAGNQLEMARSQLRTRSRRAPRLIFSAGLLIALVIAFLIAIHI